MKSARWTIRSFTQLFAFIMGLETLRPLSTEPTAGLVAGQPTQRRFTNIWRKESGTWRLYARHANVIANRKRD